MSIRWIAFVAATLLAIATVFILPRLQSKIPDVPDNNIHIKVSDISECINCHSLSGGNPLPVKHAAREQCLYCHRMEVDHRHQTLDLKDTPRANFLHRKV
ncbi:MAG: hypothetical protein HZA12_07420 [Nitrospirae bacterium]|nr:hypothetical protein [Nitrospirota bacterium]